MKIGDKVLIIETGQVGIILAETKANWKIDFLDGSKPVAVKKTTPMEVVKQPTPTDPKPNQPTKKVSLFDKCKSFIKLYKKEFTIAAIILAAIILAIIIF